VILFVILGHVPTVLLIAQVGMLYLAWLDLRAEDDLDFQVKVWWLLLVLIFNVLGFLAEKLWIYERRRRRRAATHDR
jgi:heme/copper-type cytochrome/quinol oxidase subunit 2